MIIDKFRAKTLIRTTAHKTQYHLNPYQGCFHSCVYCDGKTEGYFMHKDFNERIRVKENASELLEVYLSKRGFFPYQRTRTSTLIDYQPQLREASIQTLPPKFILFIGGGICDVYQPVEEVLNITRKLLQVAYDYCFPIRTLTKNSLILRDIDLLKRIHESSFARASLTITLADEEMQKIFEPQASTSDERFEAIRILRREGIPSGIYITPVLPFIGDSNKNLHALFKYAKEVDAEFIITGGLTLKPGRNKDDFLQIIKTYYPELESKYLELYGNNDRFGQPDLNVTEKMNILDVINKGYLLSKRYEIPFYEPRYIPEGQIVNNLRISTVLARIAFLKIHIIKKSKKEAYDLRRTAMFLETYKKDITTINEDSYHNLPISRSSIPYIFDMIKHNKSVFLDNLDEWNNTFFERTLN